jgi:hypothetical protein
LAIEQSRFACRLDFGFVDGEASELCGRLKTRGVAFVVCCWYSQVMPPEANSSMRWRKR